MSLIDRILSTEEFKGKPPVLIDIGASGKLHQKWKKIAPYAICIAFDADERDFDPGTTVKSKYKKLLIKKSLVSNTGGESKKFYLTNSPHCSSLLQPDTSSLSNWSFAPLFAVKDIQQLDTTDLTTTLAEFKIDYIDWYKSDSQGIDLRLFKSLEAAVRNKIIIAEFEPGILDAYINEDKLSDVLAYQDNLNKFWLADLTVKGTVRIPPNKLDELFSNKFLQKLFSKIGKISPGWAEMTYLNNYSDPDVHTKRALMMGWIAATLLKQDGFAYMLADLGKQKFTDKLFTRMKRASRIKVMASFINFRYFRLLKNKIQ